MLIATQRIRVEWAHCDSAGIIFNPHYYIWMDGGTHALLEAAGFGFKQKIFEDPKFRGCPLVASKLSFMKPLYFSQITELSSTVEKFGNTSFVVKHEFRETGNNLLVAKGEEVRVWGYSEQENITKLIASPMPEEYRQLLSVNKIVDTSVR